MNINVPVIECLVRLEFMNQMKSEFVGKYAEVEIFGCASIPGQTPLFHFLADDGGIFWRMPLHAFCWKECESQALRDLVMWDSFSYEVSVCRFDLLSNKLLTYYDNQRLGWIGDYLFTLDWFGDGGRTAGFAETPGQHKCGHMLKLRNGNFALQPNNRVMVHDPNFVTRTKRYPRMLARHLFSSEQVPGIVLEDSDAYDYSTSKES